MTDLPDRGELLVVQPGEAESHWQPAPAPFARPADVLEIERRTVFAEPLAQPGGPA